MPPNHATVGASMLALAFSFFAFVYWTLVGRAVTTVAYPRLGVLRSWLLAPGIGLAVTLLGLMALNQAGVPIAHFATLLTVTLGLAAVGVLAWRRPLTAWRKGAPFLLAIVFTLLWTGWPALETGFNWISYANDDMANYCLAAQRFMDHGFYDAPTMSDLAGRDYSGYYFFMHVADMMRFGAEHLVAWAAVIAHIKATQAFMPMIIALALVQVAGAGALVLQTGRCRRRALVTMWLLAASPLFMLGTLYQLIAQVGGVALLLVVLALLTRQWVTARRRVLVRYAVLPAIVASALCIFYPEVTPFAGLAFATVLLVWVLRHRAFPAALIGLAAYTLVGVVVLLRYNLISYVSILVVQFNGAMDASNLLLSLFPYFMLPTGFSNLFGWMPIAHDFQPVVSVSIAAGMLFAVLILARALRDAWRLTPAAILLLIQFTFAARLFTGANDFGLYKLAMWMQPVLAAGLAGWLLWLARGRTRVAAAAVAVYALTAAPTALYYTNSARGTKSGGLTELRLASRLGLHVDAPADKNAQLTSTIENVVAAKFAATELRGYSMALVSRDFFWPTTRTDFIHPPWPVRLHPHFAEMAKARGLIDWRNDHLITTGSLWRTTFTQPVVDRPTDDYISLDPRLSLFNKFDLPPIPTAHDGVFEVEPAAGVHNKLIFVHSYLGNHYYLGDRRRIAFFQQEQDLFAKGHDFNGIGRFMLLRIEHPSPKVYLRISATRTLVTGNTEWKPKAVVHGVSDLPLGAVGNGAFNLFVGPLTPETFEGAHYLAIDFAEYPRLLIDFRTGLKRLYNQKVPLDYRRLIGWARDVSAISEDEYNHLKRPRAVAKFPEDLALAHNLEYSGAYEDGWLSPHSKFVLDGARPAELLLLRGVVPLLPGSPLGSGTLHVRVNDTDVCDLPAPVGTFDWLLPIPKPSNATKVELTFTVSTGLPGRDLRPAAAQLRYIGFAEDSGTIDSNYNEAGRPRLASPGIDQDGWMGREAQLVLPPTNTPMTLTLEFENPKSDASRDGVVHAKLAGTDIAREVAVAAGSMGLLQLQVPASKDTQVLHLSGPAEYPLPAPDTRHRSIRIAKLHLAPST